LCGQTHAAQRVPAGSQRHAACRQLENIGAAGVVEDVWPTEKARERLTIGAVADKAEARRRNNFARDASHLAASAAEYELKRHIHLPRTGWRNAAKPALNAKLIITLAWRSSAFAHTTVRISTTTNAPPAIASNERPNRLYDPERPCALQETISRSRSACSGERQNEPRAAVLQGVTDQHRRNGNQAEETEGVHPTNIPQ
ncbi:MAG: hypothetical protein WAL89_10195, partial [Candidatus Sulfotelmatobacter sp.]